MRVFFLCRTGHHISLVAAEMFLGRVAQKSFQDIAIARIAGFDDFKLSRVGAPFFAGRSNKGTDVYTVGTARKNSLMCRILNDLIGLNGTNQGEWQVIDLSPYTSKWTGIALFLRRIGLKALSRAFFQRGVRSEIPRIIKLLEGTRF